MREKEHKLLTRYKEKWWSWNGASRSCGVFVLGCVQHLPGQCSEQSEVTLKVALLLAEPGPHDVQRSLYSCVIL